MALKNPAGAPLADDSRDHFDLSYADPSFLNDAYRPLAPALPFDNQPASFLNADISTIDPLAGIVAPGSAVQQVQNIETDLLMIRAEMPFLPIMRYPRIARGVFMATINTSVDVIIPDGAVLVRFRGPGDWYVCLGGRAQIPSAANVPNGFNDLDTFYKPDAEWYYCGGAKSFSVISPAVNMVVTASFIMRPSPNNGA